MPARDRKVSGMLDKPGDAGFPVINKAYNTVFRPNRLSIGLVSPVEAYGVGATPGMAEHIARVQLAEELGFTTIWLRDVPFNVPSFGDPGQIFDPFVYLGALASATSKIALGTASIILPLRHPAHVAKSAATVDVLSGGRLLLGVASGDRPEEYPALNMTFPDRGDRFRESMGYMRAVAGDYPHHQSAHGALTGQIDMLPKPTGPRIPMLVTGGSQQAPEWVAENGDGWITYPRDATSQGKVIAAYRDRIKAADGSDKPVMQSLYIDLLDEPEAGPRPIHLGFQSGSRFLLRYLEEVQALGVNHVALNLRFNQSDIPATMRAARRRTAARIRLERGSRYAQDHSHNRFDRRYWPADREEALGCRSYRPAPWTQRGKALRRGGPTWVALSKASERIYPTWRRWWNSRRQSVRKHASLDVIINNAGVLKAPKTTLDGGLDIRFVVNTFAPYVLMQHLLPIVPKDGRIVNLSSAAQAKVDARAMRGERHLDDMSAYAQSKLAITIWTRELAEELSEGPVVVAVNPGSLLASKMVKEGFGVDGKDISIGADILVEAALGDRFNHASGRYFDNDSGRFSNPHPAALDAGHAADVMEMIRDYAARYTGGS